MATPPPCLASCLHLSHLPPWVVKTDSRSPQHRHSRSSAHTTNRPPLASFSEQMSMVVNHTKQHSTAKAALLLSITYRQVSALTFVSGWNFNRKPGKNHCTFSLSDNSICKVKYCNNAPHHDLVFMLIYPLYIIDYHLCEITLFTQ